MRYPKGLEICQARRPRHQDSFWYDGLVATYKGYELRAIGDIDVRANVGVKVPHSCKWHDIAFEAKTDAGLERLVGSNEGIPGSSEWTRKYLWINNNWFEVLAPDGDTTENIVYGYDEGIEMLINTADKAENDALAEAMDREERINRLVGLR